MNITTNRNWKLIFKTNNYNSIFIKSTDEQNCLTIFYRHIEEIQNIKDFLILMPSFQELDNKDTTNYLHKFAPLLKSFVEESNKKTLITEESVLNILLKEEKRTSFFKFLAKQNKNIVIFCKEDYDKYVRGISAPYLFFVMEYQDWKNNTELFERFDDIKLAISKTYNPFKNPVFAFKKYIQEEN